MGNITDNFVVRIIIIIVITILVSNAMFMAFDNSWSLVQKRGELHLGYNKSYDNASFVLELATEVSKRIGVNLMPQAIDWSEKEKALDAGMVDCLWGGVKRLDSEDNSMTFSKPYMKDGYLVGFRRGNVALKNKVQVALVATIKDGTAKNIANRWFTKDVILEPK
ncbi:hypothetical protein RsTz2092_08820 [Deferribacterales bacterium RsTz2092]|nr:hypothetical protein AGMMS49941_06090 [Deferribacterales bacterium]